MGTKVWEQPVPQGYAEETQHCWSEDPARSESGVVWCMVSFGRMDVPRGVWECETWWVTHSSFPRFLTKSAVSSACH